MHPILRALADRRLGVFTAAEARAAGYEHPEIRRLRTSGRWVALRRGVYVTAEDLAAQESAGRRHAVDCTAVLLGLGRTAAAVSHTSAARLMGVPVNRGLDRTVRLTDPALWRRGEGFRVVPAPLPAEDLVTGSPPRRTAPARTLVDCAREWPLEDAVIAMDAALLAGWTTEDALARAVGRAQGWPGAARAARAVGLADGRAESVLETRGRLRLLGSGFPAPQLQVEIHAGRAFLGVVDAWFDDEAVAVEFDGRVKYTQPWRGRTPERVLWDEKRREDEMRALGVRFLRLADADLARWPVVEKRLRRLLDEPGPALRSFAAVPRARGVRRSA
ncbi:type IV toxin-antitoxin system AbiEi family antitoxin domain-containing protein [Blastococcus sp. SYSU D00669]